MRSECSDVSFSICESFSNGGNGAVELAREVIKLSEKKVDFNYLYDLDISLEEKINKICLEIYRAKKVKYSSIALKKIKNLSSDFSKLPVCIAKTPYSLSDDEAKVVHVGDYDIHVSDIKVNNGAGFIVVYLSNILTLPGLGKNANLYKIDLDKNGKVVGLD